MVCCLVVAQLRLWCRCYYHVNERSANLLPDVRQSLRTHTVSPGLGNTWVHLENTVDL